MAPKKDTQAGKPKKGGNPAITAYTVLYNSVLAVGWAYVLYLAVDELLANNYKWDHVYARVAGPLKIFQTAAVLEVLHAILGIVPSSVPTTAIQVASRVIILWGIAVSFPQVQGHWSFTTMVISWAITEVIRYGYYVFSKLNAVPYILLWLRYTLFFVLYPTGAGSEFILAYNALPYVTNPYLYYGLAFLLLLYFPLFPHMYFHMIGQRKKQLRPKDKSQ